MSPTGRRAIRPSEPPDARRQRVRRRLLIALGVVVFLVLSGLLARFLTTDNLEREEDVALIQAEAKGDANTMLDKLSGCRERAACVAEVRRDAANPRLRRTGAVKILSLTSATANSPTGATGRTRLAWTVLGENPIVQCIDVRRSGNALSGVSVKLLSISAPIENEADC